ncbi:MAG: hypothetical protein KDD73_04155 [Anaerolineales bacterium]|nr:hypothetical protein [Anaerolineales bacterium]
MTAHRPLNHEESQQQLFAALHALRRRLRWRDNVHALTRWGWALLLPALAVALLAFVQPIANAWLWTALAVGGALLGWLLWSLLRPLSLARVARRVDAEAQTHERLATALELGAAHNRDPLPLRQQQDAAQRAATWAANPTSTLPWRWERRPLIGAGILTLFLLVAPLLPNPQEAILAQRAIVQRVAKAEAEKLDELQQQLEEENALPREAREALLRELESLERNLEQNEGDLEQALADIEKARQALEERLDANRAGREAALQQTVERLQQMSQQENASARDAAQALADQAASASEAERRAQASALREQAAQAAATDPALAEALQSLANAIEGGDGAAAQAAADALADTMAQTEQALADQAAIAEALGQVEQSRQAMANAPLANGQTAQNSGDGQGQGAGSGQGQGQGAGNGQGQGQGQGPGVGGGGGGSTSPTDQGGRDGSGTFQGSDPNNLGTQNDGEAFFGGSDEILVPEWGDPSLVRGQASSEGQTQSQEGSGIQPGLNNGAIVPSRNASASYESGSYQASGGRPSLAPYYEELILRYGERLRGER